MLNISSTAFEIATPLIQRFWQQLGIHVNLQQVIIQGTLGQPRLFKIHDIQVRFQGLPLCGWPSDRQMGKQLG
jgi:hypothetical protein